MPKLRRMLLLVSRDHDLAILHGGHAGHDGLIVPEHPVAVQFHEIVEDVVDVIVGGGAPRVAGQLDPLPGLQLGEDLLAQLVGLGLQLCHLVGNIHAPDRGGVLQGLDLFFQFHQWQLEIEPQGLFLPVHATPVGLARPGHR
jgi:hypothetical protein